MSRYRNVAIGEATVTLPLVAGCAYHRGAWRARAQHRYAKVFEKAGAAKQPPEDGHPTGGSW